MRVFAILCVLVMSSIGVGIGVEATVGPRTSAELNALAPGAVVTTPPGLLDNACGPAGTLEMAALATPKIDAGVIPALATQPDGAIVVLEYSVFHNARVLLRGFTSECTPDAFFGNDGTEVLTAEANGKPASDALFQGLTSERNGDLYLLGGTQHGWLIARLLPTGRLDPTFGRGGWDQLSVPGGATSLTELRDGELVVGGNSGGGCCVLEWVVKLDSDGRLETAFGTRGRTSIPPGEDSEIDQIIEGPGGSLLVDTGAGNMGCWSVQLTALGPSGMPEPGLEKRVSSAVAHRVGGAFVGQVVPDGRDFLLVGTGQSGCVGSRPVADESGHVFRLSWSGQLLSDIRFQEPMLWSVLAVRSQGGILLAGTSAFLPLGRTHLRRYCSQGLPPPDRWILASATMDTQPCGSTLPTNQSPP